MELILITKDLDLAILADICGVDIIMVDLEILGKKERQGHLNTVISEHKIEDVAKIKSVLSNSNLMVRINPINENSELEIDDVIIRGADLVMLPMFTSALEVQKFISFVNGRAKTVLLLETPQAMVRIDEILTIKGIDRIHIGLNDLHLGMGLKFMFELLSGGIIEYLSKKIISRGIKFGFGGIARIGKGTLDSSLILSEHFRLNSTMVILSRDFHGYSQNYKDVKNNLDLKYEVEQIRKAYNNLSNVTKNDLENNRILLVKKVLEIVKFK